MPPRKLITRCDRYPSARARITARTTPDTANAEKTLIGRPANHSAAPTMIAMVIVVERFGSRMISTQTNIATGTSGIRSSLIDALSRRRDASRCAPPDTQRDLDQLGGLHRHTGDDEPASRTLAEHADAGG